MKESEITKHECEKRRIEFSKKLINDIRALLWAITLSGIALAFLCIFRDFTGGLPWISAMVGLPWSAHGVVCAAYMSKSKVENSTGGIVYQSMMNEFEVEATCNNWQSPEI